MALRARAGMFPCVDAPSSSRNGRPSRWTEPRGVARDPARDSSLRATRPRHRARPGSSAFRARGSHSPRRRSIWLFGRGRRRHGRRWGANGRQPCPECRRGDRVGVRAVGDDLAPTSRALGLLQHCRRSLRRLGLHLGRHDRGGSALRGSVRHPRRGLGLRLREIRIDLEPAPNDRGLGRGGGRSLRLVCVRGRGWANDRHRRA